MNRLFALSALSVALSFSLSAGPASTNEYAGSMRDYLQRDVMGWASDPVIIRAIEDQNARLNGISAVDIGRMDDTWETELKSDQHPLVDRVMNNRVSGFLRDKIETSAGTITEVFVMDNHGLNVAASTVTSDYWQGDEAKWLETYAKGPDAVHIGEIRFDETTLIFQAQISITLIDPDTQEPVGAMTVGLNADMLY